MSDENIKRYTIAELRRMVAAGEDRTDWDRVRAMTEEELEQAIAEDPDSDFEVDDEQPAMVLLPVNADLVAGFRKLGDDYEARIEEVLRAWLREHDREAA